MKDRTIKAKSPWFRLFTIGNPVPLDDLAKAQSETVQQIRTLHKEGKGIKRRILK
jgi:hypothetical protein